MTWPCAFKSAEYYTPRGGALRRTRRSLRAPLEQCSPARCAPTFALCCLLGSCGYWAPHTPHFTIRPCSYAFDYVPFDTHSSLGHDLNLTFSDPSSLRTDVTRLLRTLLDTGLLSCWPCPSTGSLLSPEAEEAGSTPPPIPPGLHSTL